MCTCVQYNYVRAHDRERARGAKLFGGIGRVEVSLCW